MNIKIISDSTCDLSQELVDKYDITIIPLTVIKDGKNFSDGVDITTTDIFAHVAAGGDLCSTTAMNMGEYESFFAKFASDYDGVIHINIGSGFSSSYQNACLAAEEFSNVSVIDSRNLSTGQGLVVLKVCEMAANGSSVEDISAEAASFVGKVEASFLLTSVSGMPLLLLIQQQMTQLSSMYTFFLILPWEALLSLKNSDLRLITSEAAERQ